MSVYSTMHHLHGNDGWIEPRTQAFSPQHLLNTGVKRLSTRLRWLY